MNNYKLLKLPQVLGMVLLSRSQLYLLVGSGEFPAPIKLSKRAVAWLESDIHKWIESRTAKSMGNPNEKQKDNAAPGIACH